MEASLPLRLPSLLLPLLLLLTASTVNAFVRPSAPSSPSVRPQSHRLTTMSSTDRSVRQPRRPSHSRLRSKTRGGVGRMQACRGTCFGRCWPCSCPPGTRCGARMEAQCRWRTRIKEERVGGGEGRRKQLVATILGNEGECSTINHKFERNTYREQQCKSSMSNRRIYGSSTTQTA